MAARGLPVTLSFRSFTIVSTCAETPANSLQNQTERVVKQSVWPCAPGCLPTEPEQLHVQSGTLCGPMSTHSRVQQEAVHVDDVAANGAQGAATADGVAPPGPVGAHPRLQPSRCTL